MMTIGSKLLQLRKKAGLSAAELSERSGIHLISLYKYEKNGAIPTIDTLLRLGSVLGVRLSAFEDCTLPADGRQRNRKVKASS